MLWFALGVVASLWLVGMIAQHYLTKRSSLHGLGLTPTDRALFVVAHPDDESMFFVPTIRALRLQRVECRLLCLSTGKTEEERRRSSRGVWWHSSSSFAAGNYEGKGGIRRKELVAATSILGFAAEHVVLPSTSASASASAAVAFEEFSDGPRHEWPTDRLMRVIQAVVDAEHITHVCGRYPPPPPPPCASLRPLPPLPAPDTFDLLCVSW